MKCKEFSVSDKEGWEIKHTFERVSSAEVMCPIFVVDQPGDVKVKLEMSYYHEF